ncbi:MAG TPA: hypothetical protein VEJ36_08300 [Nitrososphaerales archaeon]|nr:hypothetical protein [Nitrososphaerales archaeon]
MRRWLPAAFVVLLVLGYLTYLELGSSSAQGGGSFDLLNTIGLLSVLVGVVAALVILKRSAPPGTPRNA